MTANKPQVTVIGGGMICHDQILPSLYHLQRQGRIGAISVCASTYDTVRKLADAELHRAFPGQSFRMYPPGPTETRQPELYREAIAIWEAALGTSHPDVGRGLMNLAAFYDAFGVKEGDKMYLPPNRRVTIW